MSLSYDAVLKNWRKHVCTAQGAYVIWGQIFDDTTKTFLDGEIIHTAEISDVCGNMVVSKDGIKYLLIGEQDGPEVNPWAI